jgi:hypothetical protein
LAAFFLALARCFLSPPLEFDPDSPELELSCTAVVAVVAVVAAAAAAAAVVV